MDATGTSAQQAIAAFAGAEVAHEQDQRVQLTLTALNSFARIRGGLPGPKSIIWVTSARRMPRKFATLRHDFQRSSCYLRGGCSRSGHFNRYRFD